ncbi:MAG: electron transfer flavoprotein subunit beta [Microbacteriaceae bacterium]|nr:electron transfer flavoprotein subunit beta [Microbacteriaceae bacterium]
MKIVVLIKEVPDTWGERRLDPGTRRVDRAGSDGVLDEIGERAVEAALAYKDGAADTEVVVVSMGPSSTSILRRALAMGATSAVHIVDDRLVGADLGWTAAALAGAIERTGFDLVIAGGESTDGRGGVIPAMVAEHLGVPLATGLSTLQISPDGIRGERTADEETLTISAALPAVVSITERMPDARFPSFKGTMGAKKKPLEVLSTADLGPKAAQVIDTAARSIVVEVVERPARVAGPKIVDDGTAVAQLVDFLSSKQLV